MEEGAQRAKLRTEACIRSVVITCHDSERTFLSWYTPSAKICMTHPPDASLHGTRIKA